MLNSWTYEDECMKKYIFFFLFNFLALYFSVSYAGKVSENILADAELMESIGVEQLEEYISQGADVNARGRDILAMITGKDVNIVKSVFKGGGKDDEKTNDLGNSDVTPLMYALKGQNYAIIPTLLNNGADVNAHDSSGNSVLIYACRFKANADVIKMLIKYGANINARDNDWKSVLMYASQNDNVEILQILVNAGANINAKMENGTTALTIAAQNNPNLNVVKFLLENGADINARVMLKAVQTISSTTKNIRKKQKAIKATTNLDVTEVAKTATSWYAKTKGIFMDNDIKEGAEDTANKLTEVEEIYNNAEGKTVLMIACENTNPEIVEFLFNYKINVNERGPFGMTALMYACDSKTTSDVRAIKILLERGADTNIVNEYGETALDYLKDNKVKKENPEYWDVFELYNQIAEANLEAENINNSHSDDSQNNQTSNPDEEELWN